MRELKGALSQRHRGISPAGRQIARAYRRDTLRKIGPLLHGRSQLRQAVDQPLKGANGGNNRTAEALISEIAWEECDDLPQKLCGLTVVAQGEMRFAQDEIRRELEDHIAEVAGDRQSVL